jgi:uncharacterized protein DUF4337
MPGDAEIETDRLHEQIQEELEHQHEGLLKAVALTTALFAALAAIVALRAGSSVNQALVLKTESARLQVEASDQWAAYQAKTIKSAIQAASENSWLAIGKQPPGSFSRERERYAREQAAIEQIALQKQRARDLTSAEADHLLHQHHRFADSVALLQVAIALGAVAALAHARLIWLTSMTVGVAGAALFLLALFQ